MKKLSVVSITYCDSTGLRKTIVSLAPLYEAHLDFEHIVVDSSPDENAGVLGDLPADYPIVHISTPPEGIYAAMNAGAARAEGEALWFLNSGDRLNDFSVLREFLEFLERDASLDLLCGAALLTRGEETIHIRRPLSTLLKSLLEVTYNLPHQSILYRRAAFLKVAPYNTQYRIAADFDLHWRIYASGFFSKMVPEILSACELGGLSDTAWWLSWQESWKVAQSLKGKVSGALVLRFEMVLLANLLKTFVLRALHRANLCEFIRSIWNQLRGSS